VFAVGLETHIRTEYCHQTWATEILEFRAAAQLMLPFFSLSLLYVLSFLTAFSPRITAAVSAMLGILVILSSASAANDWVNGLECTRESYPAGEDLQFLAILAAWPWSVVEILNFINFVALTRLRRSSILSRADGEPPGTHN
jgi:hypothetical protein